MEGADMQTARWISRGAKPDSLSGAIAGLGGAMWAVSAVLVLGTAVAISAGAAVDQGSSSSGLSSKLITVSDMPSGWVTKPATGGKASTPCLNILALGTLHLPSAHVTYEENGGGEVYAESINEAPSATIARADLAKLVSGQAHCNNSTFPSTNGITGHMRVANVNVAAVGDHSSAHAYTLTAGSSVIAYVNLVTFEQGRYIGFLAQTDSTGGPPDVATEAQLDQAAFNRLQGNTASIGSTQNMVDDQGNQLAVTVVRVINPAQAANGLPVLGGGILVAVELKVTNKSNSRVILSPSDVSLQDTAGTTNTSEGQPINGCTNLALSGTVAADATIDGCFSFSVPAGTTPSMLTFAPSGSSAGATWHLS
jgi:hypothetical protein